MWKLIREAPSAPDAAGKPDVRRGLRVAVAQTQGCVWLGYLGGAVRITRDDAGGAAGARPRPGPKAATGAQSLRAPMAGRIVEQHAVAGARCKQGEVLVVLEAMKMEYKLCAPAAGRITVSCGAAGDAVALDAVLVTLVCDDPG